MTANLSRRRIYCTQCGTTHRRTDQCVPERRADDAPSHGLAGPETAAKARHPHQGEP